MYFKVDGWPEPANARTKDIASQVYAPAMRLSAPQKSEHRSATTQRKLTAMGNTHRGTARRNTRSALLRIRGEIDA